MLNCTFKPKKIEYKIIGSKMMDCPITGEPSDGVEFVETNSNNDTPKYYLWTEYEFFTKVDSTDLKLPKYVPSPPSLTELDQIKRFKQKYPNR